MSLFSSIVRLLVSRRSYNKNYKPKHGIADFDEIGNPKFTRYIIESLRERYIAFDVETTGLHSENGDRIVEIAAVLFVEGEPVKSFCSLVNPQRFIPLAAAKINGISNLVIWLAPSEKIVLNNFLEFIDEAINGNTIMCAHNAYFDFNFLIDALKRFGYRADFRIVDTLYLAQKFVRKVNNHKLGTLAEHYEIEFTPHRAVDDAYACGLILWEILNDVEKAREKRGITPVAKGKKGLRLRLRLDPYEILKFLLQFAIIVFVTCYLYEAYTKQTFNLFW